MEITRELLHSLPKTDLHVHLDGSLRPATMLEIAREHGIALPASDADSLTDFMHVDDARDLVEYLQRFEITLSLMQTADAIERIAYELAMDAAAENTRYIEVRFCPALNTRRGLTHADVLDAALRGLRRAETEAAIRTGVIVCAIKNHSSDLSFELARTAVDFMGRGVVAFDLAGPEAGFPVSLHRHALDFAAQSNLPITLHAGEAYGAVSIREAIHSGHARRIGHGTRLYEDAALLQFVNNFRIPLEVCLTSNVQTRVSPTMPEHPARSYYDQGLVVTLNTDNRLMSRTTLTDELWAAHTDLGFDWDELCDVIMMGFESAFLPYHTKTALLGEIAAELSRFENE